MAGTETKRIIELTEASTVQSGDFIAVDSNARGTKKVSTDTLATSAALAAETNARTGADEQISERMDGIEEQTALIQNPTKTLSGALVSFTDGADMPMVACTASIVPKQSGTGTPSPDNVRPISGWESVSVDVSGKNLSEINETEATTSVRYIVNNANLPNSDYVISFELVNATYTNGSGALLDLYDANNVNFAYPTPSQLRRVSDDAQMSSLSQPISGRFYYKTSAHSLKEIRLQFRSDGYGYWSGTIKNIQLEHGAEASNYSPTITPTTKTVNLGRTVYGGTLDVVSGVLTVDRAMVDLGTLAWGLWTGARYRAALPDFSGGAYNSDLSKFLSSALSPKVRDASWDAMGDWQFGVYDTYVVVVKSGTTASDLKTALNGVQFVYPVTTPQTYTLTPTEVKTLLGDNNVWADSGDVEITYRRDISIVLENLENALSGSNSLNTMMMSAPTENTAEEPAEDEAEDDMR